MKKISAEYRIKLNKVFVISVTWLFIAFIITTYDHLVVYSLYSAGPAYDYTFFKSLYLHLAGAFIGSILGGSFLVFYINEKYRAKPYWQSIVVATIGFFTIVAFITVVLGAVIAKIQTGSFISTPASREVFDNFVFNSAHLKNAIVWGIIVMLTQFSLQVNDKFGRGTLWNFIKGKYHFPQKEHRIFMFVDLKSSTSLAEKLGNEKYHGLLKDFFADITNPIIYNKGEIYQYVGDEVVISWKMKNGILDNHCVKCFFDMRQAILDREKEYEKKYGLIPDFKAGIHFGEVIAGEIGIVKKDITFSGDVLNTTARIQAMCNEFGVRILSSDELLNLLPYEGLFQRTSIGAFEFRGKEHSIAISTLHLKS